jgi:hypothetical protein
VANHRTILYYTHNGSKWDMWRETIDIEEKRGGSEGRKIILKQIVKKWDLRIWSEFI